MTVELDSSTLGPAGQTLFGEKNPHILTAAPQVIQRTSTKLVSKGNKKIKGKYRTGGAFFLEKDLKDSIPQSVMINNAKKGTAMIRYNGPVAVQFPPHIPGLNINLIPAQQFGSSAFVHARNRISSPSFDGVTEMIELRELPSMFKDQLDLLRRRFSDSAAKKMYGKPPSKVNLGGAGEDYLQFWFGFIPLYNSIKNFTQSLSSLDTRLSQLIRDNGQEIYRRGMITTHSESLYASDTTLPLLYGLNNQLFTSWKSGRKTSVTSRVWYAGKFRYWLPPGRTDSEQYIAMMRRRILGVRLTPGQLYNAMPWSWLLDYFTDTGTLIDAMSPGVEDRFVANYMYVMKTDTLSTERLTTLDLKTGDRLELRSYNTYLTKQRAIGRPFQNQGILDENLSLFQMSILGALGLSRLPV